MTIPLKRRPDGLGEFELTDFIPIEHGGTGASTLADAKEALEIPLNTDGLEEGEVNLYFSNSRVLSATLSTLSLGDDLEISATDTLIEALSKLQAQINTLKNP